MSYIARTAFRATRTMRAAGANAGSIAAETQAERDHVKQGVLKKGAKRDPELYVLLGIMTGAFGLAGFYFARKPTSSSSEQQVAAVPNSEPWNSDTQGKYQYHPGGDTSLAPKDAPSALHSVIIPNVNLPKHLHDQFNKYDKEEFDDY